MSESNRAVVKKRVANAVLYENGLIKIENVRLSYPHLFEKWAPAQSKPGESNAPAYAAKFYAPKATHREMKDLIREVMAAMCKENQVRDVAEDKKFIRDGDKSAKEDQVGMYVINARDTNKKPFARAANKQPLDPVRDVDVLAPGVLVNGVIRPWFQKSTQWGTRINCGIVGVQLVKDDGVRFGQAGISDETVDDMLDDVDEDTDGSTGSTVDVDDL